MSRWGRAAMALVGVALLATSACAVGDPAAPQPSTAPPGQAAQAGATLAPAPVVPPYAVVGDVGAKVRELQARLREAGALGGYDLTDVYGPATKAAVADYQGKAGLTVTGDADAKTWAALTAATRAPTSAELANQVPGATVIAAGDPRVPELLLRLAQAGTYTGPASGDLTAAAAAISAFQKAQGIPVSGAVDQRTWDRLLASTRTPTPWELKGQPAPVVGPQDLDPRCQQGRVICASMDQRKVSWVVDGKILMTLDARYGLPEFPTNPGEFHVYYKSPLVISELYGNAKMPWSMCFDDSRCVHYSADFVWQGWDGWGSHGCINVRDLDALAWLYTQVNIGDRVVVY